ncbi:MAG: arginine--tRNA ligase [Lachnospiraceae bacterium]|nr:arginine--tRNA ligase [Lachnospiraceae bacterium]
MKKIIELLEEEIGIAFTECGYEKELGRVTVSNRPDLCEYQCNGALAGAKKFKKAPLIIANEVKDKLLSSGIMTDLEAVKPGFINFNISSEFLAKYLTELSKDENLGVRKAENPFSIIMDYGGPNAAKPLHVGHLRSAIIGESIKRIARYVGHNVISDIHLGDWGYQMGLIITEVSKRMPELPYFDDKFAGEYPSEAPFTVSELEEIYPFASGKAKEDEAYREEALEATNRLQHGNKGYIALWNHIMNVSTADLKKNYDRLDVHFDLWKGESSVNDIIAPMVERFKEEGYARFDQGALVIDVSKPEDKKEIPPCIILKSDGAALYATTDLATLVEREKEYKPDQVIYIVDKRQDMHFLQVFRAAKITKIVPEDTKLDFLGFGTMNGKDGKPFKTRDGGVMRLEYLIDDIDEKMYQKIIENKEMEPDEAKEIAKIVGLAAIKYGDLSNQASKDYVFDLDKFMSFEGNTGPYILYTIVRIKSILKKYSEEKENVCELEEDILPANSEALKKLSLDLTEFSGVIENAYKELAPHKLCAYIYELSNDFNRFYHETNIMKEENENNQKSYIRILELTKNILEKSVNLLGFSAPDRM